MTIDILEPAASADRPAASRTHKQIRGARAAVPRIVRIGILGLGNVGQAVARLLWTQRERLLARGLDFRITSALVRDSSRRRDGVEHNRITRDAVRFLRADFDVAIEVLGGIEPGRQHVAALLRRGVPVVTANKSLLAAAGDELREVARASGTSLRCEASVIAGVPFLGGLQRRPLAAGVERLSGIVNGTSNYVLSRGSRDGVSIAEALREAQARGFAEPDASKDVLGIDAAEKLAILLHHVGVAGVRAGQLEIRGILELTPADFAAAREFGGAIKPVVAAEIAGRRVEAFVGPAFVANANPLARVADEQNGLRLSGRLIGDLFYSGPGAGPDVTAATILDDVVETIEQPARHEISRGSANAADDAPDIVPPATPWFVRLSFTRRVADVRRVADFLAARGVWLSRFDVPIHSSNVYARTQACSRTTLEAALADLRVAAACETCAIRVLED